jgi:CubicO group peptidase (beta-lactamase class C family)
MRIIKNIIIHLGIITSMSLLLILFLYHPIPTVDHIDLYEDQIDAQIVEMMERYDIPGVQLTLFDHEEQVNKTFGYIDLNNMDIIDDQTVFRAQSLSKTVTAVLILKMVENNQIELDAQLKDLVSESFISKIPDIFHDVTIHQILKHEAYMPLGDFNRMFAINDQSMMSLEEALIYDLNQKRPNGGYFYSNVGYNLLEYIINQVDEDGYEHLAKTYVFEPLEMMHTSFSYDDIDLDDLAFGYDQYKNRIDHYRYPELGSGGLLSTSSDYYKFLYGLIHGEIIDNEHIDLLLTFDPDISLGSYGLAFDGYGYGVFVESMGESVTFAHGGQGLGFMAFYHIDLKNQSGYVVMSNSQRTYPLISMLSTMLNDAYDLDAPGIKNIHTLMIIFEVLIAMTLYCAGLLIFKMIKKKQINKLLYYILFLAFWVLTAYFIIYFLTGNYMFIHVLIPIHFEYLVYALLILNLSIGSFVSLSLLKKIRK